MNSEVRSEAYVRPCTCHPDDNPPVPCAQQYALNECRAKADQQPAQPATDERGRPMTYWGGQPAQPESGEADDDELDRQTAAVLFRMLREGNAQIDGLKRQLSAAEAERDSIRIEAGRQMTERLGLQQQLTAAQQRIAALTAEVMHYTAGTPHPAEQREAELREYARRVEDLFVALAGTISDAEEDRARKSIAAERLVCFAGKEQGNG